jgi:hypothetical protein
VATIAPFTRDRTCLWSLAKAAAPSRLRTASAFSAFLSTRISDDSRSAALQRGKVEGFGDRAAADERDGQIGHGPRVFTCSLGKAAVEESGG